VRGWRPVAGLYGEGDLVPDVPVGDAWRRDGGALRKTAFPAGYGLDHLGRPVLRIVHSEGRRQIWWWRAVPRVLVATLWPPGAGRVGGGSAGEECITISGPPQADQGTPRTADGSVELRQRRKPLRKIALAGIPPRSGRPRRFLATTSSWNSGRGKSVPPAHVSTA